MAALSLVDFGTAAFRRVQLPSAARRVWRCRALLILFGSGPGRSGAKVNLGPVQPIEAIRLLLALFPGRVLRAALGAAQGNPQQRDSRRPAAGMAEPAARRIRAAGSRRRRGGAGVLLRPEGSRPGAVPLLRLPGDVRGRARPGGDGRRRLRVAAGRLLSRLLAARLANARRARPMWQSPWDNAVAGGDQVAQAIWAMATGGAFGHRPRARRLALPAGRPHRSRPRGDWRRARRSSASLRSRPSTRCIAWRGFRIARSASTDYGFFLATALTLFLIVPALVMAAGVLGAIPLTGVVTPFLSYGGSAMAANFAALGILSSIHADKRPAADFSRSRAAALGERSARRGGAGAGRRRVNVQVVHADDYVGAAAARRPGRRRPPLRLQPARARRGAADPARHDLRPARPAARDRRSRAARTRAR